MKIHVTCVCACVHLGLTVSADDISLSRYFILGLFFPSSGPLHFQIYSLKAVFTVLAKHLHATTTTQQQQHQQGQ